MLRRKNKLGTLKITGGMFRGQTILTPGGKTHPMGERERLALFNMLEGMDPTGLILDAYAGSGALGIEAISRGAWLVLFVEKDGRACRVIQSNLNELGIIVGKVLKADVIKVASDATDRFGVVIADPPYDKYDPEEIAKLTRVVADPDGILVLSHPGEAPELPHMKLYKSKKYAGATISIYRHENWE